VINTPIPHLAKASIILLLWRIGNIVPKYRFTILAIFWFNILACVIPEIILIFMCPPAPNNTDISRRFGVIHCMGRKRVGELNIFQVAVNLLTDILIFPIPFWIMWNLGGASRRLQLVFVFLFATSLW